MAFDSTASDPDGGTLAYAWDFGVPGTTTDTSTAADPTYTYANQGNYTATLTVTDGQGGTTVKTFAIRVTAPAGCGTSYRDDFDGADLGAGWEVVRRDQGLVVSGGTLKIPTAQGDVYGGDNNAKNIVLRAAPAGPWTMTAKIKHAGSRQYHQAGLIVYGDDDNYTKFDRLADNQPTNPATEHFEFINEVAGTPRNTSADSGGQLGATYPQDFFMKIESDGTQIRGYQSTNGTDWTLVGPPGRPAGTGNVRLGMFSLGNAAAVAVTSEFDWFTLTTPGGGSGGAGDEFNGTSLDKTRWNAIQREDTSLYSVGSGGLTMTLVQADVASGNRNYILQTADHTSPDYVLETKLSAWTFVGQFRQAGILIWQDDNNYVKFNAISDGTNTRINRFEIRSKVGGTTANGPNLNAPADLTAGIWLRLTKSGTSYSAEVSYQRHDLDERRRGRHQPDRGHEVRPLHGRRRRRGRHRDLRLLQGQRLDRLRGRYQHAAGDHLGDGDAHGGLRAAGRERGGGRQRRQRRRADVRVGLRRQRLDRRHRSDREHHLHHRGQPHDQAHRE